MPGWGGAQGPRSRSGLDNLVTPTPGPGLCGNFNQNQADDLRALSGVVEGTAAAFANTWKTQAACPNVKNIFEDPCSLSVENGTLPGARAPLPVTQDASRAARRQGGWR